ncbi:MAG: sialidase family protein [Chloroflexota bacterium]
MGATVFSGSSLAVSVGHDRFQPSASDGGESAEVAEMHDLNSFEENAEANPVTNDQVLFSRCRFEPFAGQTDTYATLASNEHDAIVNDSAFEFADGTTCYEPQNESNIVINPHNDQNVVTSSNDYRSNFGACWAYVSDNGGTTWVNIQMPGWTAATGAKGQFVKTGCGGDPVMAFAPDGTLYFAAITYNLDKFPRTMSGVAVASSKDGGHTWTPPVMVSYNAAGNFFLDKEWMAVGNDGTVYLTWTTFYSGPRGLGYLKSPIVMATSRNGGKSWSSAKEVSDAAHPYNQGSQVGMTPDGTLYVAYSSASPSSHYNTDVLAVSRSTDGGNSFTTSEPGRIYDDLDCYPLQIGAQGRQTLTNEQFRVGALPSMAIDPTNGTIAIVWADNKDVGNCGGTYETSYDGTTTSSQVRLAVSTDGITWTNSDVTSKNTSPADKVYPSVGANAGVISVGYYTRGYSPTPTDTDRLCGIMERDNTSGDLVLPTDTARKNAAVCLDWAIKVSTNGGSSFGTEVRVTSQSSNPYILFSGSFIGDYTGTAVDSQGNTVTAWTDFRGKPGVTSPNQDIMVGTYPSPIH